MHPEAQSQFRKYQNTPLLKGAIRTFTLASKILPLRFMKISAFFIILIFIALNHKNFKYIMMNISHIHPEAGLIKRALSAYRVFLNYSFYLIDLFFLSHGANRLKNYTIEIYGEENLSELIKKNSGFILLTLHMGNWEIASAVLSGKNVKSHVVYSPDSEGTIEYNRRALRDIFHVHDIPLNKGNFFSIRLLNTLRERGVVAFQGDRLMGDSGVEVEFFGAMASFPKGPVVLGMVSQVPILPVFCTMKGYHGYVLSIEKPYYVQLHTTRDETIKRALEDIVKIFEKYVLQYAEQWYSFMPFWKENETETHIS
jgi:lauroyl/myristoyl acyltransferase